MLKPNTILFLVSLSILAGIHLIALKLFLYWRFLWFDIPMHILGGSVVVLGAFAFVELRLPLAKFLVKNIWWTFGFVLTIMVGWELFELWAGIPILDNYAKNTASDLISGFVGSIIGYIVARKMTNFNLWLS